MNGPNQLRPLLQRLPFPWATPAAKVAEERPVTLTVNGEAWLTFMCTPAELEALAVGFLFNEGVIAAPADLAAVQVCSNGTNVDVWLRRAVERPPAWRRTAGCVGGATAAEPQDEVRPLTGGPLLATQAIGRMMSALYAGQRLYQAAGGIHCSALSDGQQVVVLVEDIGRHNTLDKLAGRCLLDRRVTSGSVLLTTGRVSSEMAQKAARMETPIVISRSGPSTMAVELADRAGLTLIGYARRDQFTVYTHGWRLTSAPRVSEEMAHVAQFQASG